MAQGLIPGAIMQGTAASAQFFTGASKKKRKKRTRKRAITRSPSKRRVTRRTGQGPRRPAKKRAARKKTPARLVKGSPAAKRHMAKLRRMQKRNRR